MLILRLNITYYLGPIFQVGGRRLNLHLGTSSYKDVMYGVGRLSFHLGTPLKFTTSLDVKTTKEGHELRFIRVCRIS